MGRLTGADGSPIAVPEVLGVGTTRFKFVVGEITASALACRYETIATARPPAPRPPSRS